MGEYIERVDGQGIGIYKLNTKYNSIVRYYDDLVNGKLTRNIPYNVIISDRIISCKYNSDGVEILLTASIKNRVYDRESK